MNQQIMQNLNGNLNRVRSLVSIYERFLGGTGQGRRGYLQTDVLRAATVLLHASLEDFLRSIAYWKLPLAAAEVMNEIPMIGLGSNRKYSLGDLVAHKGKKVEQLIKESVDAYLERSNYNNTNDIAGFLQSICVDITKVNTRFNEIKDLMDRRHQIVHRTDRDQVIGSGNYRIRSIGKGYVEAWISAVEEFAQAVAAQLP